MRATRLGNAPVYTVRDLFLQFRELPLDTQLHIAEIDHENGMPATVQLLVFTPDKPMAPGEIPDPEAMRVTTHEEAQAEYDARQPGAEATKQWAYDWETGGRKDAEAEMAAAS